MGALAFSESNSTCRVVDSGAGAGAVATGGAAVDIAMGVGVAVPDSSPVAVELWSALAAVVAEAMDGAGSMCLVRLGSCDVVRTTGFLQMAVATMWRDSPAAGDGAALKWSTSESMPRI